MGIGPFTGSAELGMSGFGGLLSDRLAPPLVRHADGFAGADVSLVSECDRAGDSQPADDAPDPCGGHVVHRAR
jgi:hypothetical protein